MVIWKLTARSATCLWTFLRASLRTEVLAFRLLCCRAWHLESPQDAEMQTDATTHKNTHMHHIYITTQISVRYQIFMHVEGWEQQSVPERIRITHPLRNRRSFYQLHHHVIRNRNLRDHTFTEVGRPFESLQDFERFSSLLPHGGIDSRGNDVRIRIDPLF